ncbi:MAG: hypothetical protein IPK16_07615 [Anaerolineales bacterium]|nr:hypothetical protein [Anaerolineales bacterium]
MATGDVIVSAPALAVALRRRSLSLNPAPLLPALEARSLPPMYRIDRRSVEAESAAAARVVVEVGERLRRLADAYGAWAFFEPEPYFDLQPAQTSLLVHVSERVSTVHVTFFVDALLPSFQDAVAHLIDDTAGGTTTSLWAHVVLTLTRARERLASDIGFWALNGANEERNRWRSAWNHLPDSGRMGLTCRWMGHRR